MREWKSQSHVKWYCKYHIVFSPKYRKKAMFGSLRKGVGKILRELCNQSGVELVEGHAMSDHVHLCLSIPPKYSVANTVGFLKVSVRSDHVAESRKAREPWCIPPEERSTKEARDGDRQKRGDIEIIGKAALVGVGCAGGGVGMAT